MSSSLEMLVHTLKPRFFVKPFQCLSQNVDDVYIYLSLQDFKIGFVLQKPPRHPMNLTKQDHPVSQKFSPKSYIIAPVLRARRFIKDQRVTTSMQELFSQIAWYDRVWLVYCMAHCACCNPLSMLCKQHCLLGPTAQVTGHSIL